MDPQIETTYGALLHNALDAVFLTSPDGTILYANPAACTLFGYTLDEFRAFGRSAIVDPTDPGLAEALEQRRRTGSFSGILRLLRKDRSPLTVEISSAVFMDANKELRTSIFVRDISERKRAEDELRMSRELLSSAFNTSPLLMTISDMATGKYLDVNDSFCATSGFSREEAVGKTSAGLGWISGEDHDRLMHELKQQGQVIGQDLHLLRKNKTRILCRFAGKVIKTTEGDRLFLTAEDISAHTQEEDRVKTILRMAMDGFYLVDMEGEILETNNSYCSIIGYSYEELLTMSVKDVEVLDTQEVIAKRLQQIIGTGYARFETKHRRKDGTVIDIEASVNYLSEKQPKFFCFMRDITARKRAEEALLYFKMAVGSATDAIGMSTPAGRHYYQNEAYTKLFGLSVSEVDGVSGPPATVYVDEKVGRKVFDIIMGGGSFVGEVKMLDKDRKEKDIYLRAYSIKNKKGNVVGLVGVHNDITNERLAEQKLRKSESRLRESQQIARLGSWDLDLAIPKLEWSDETYRLFDQAPENFVPSFDTFARLVHPDDRETMQTNFDRALASDASPYHVAVRIINGSGRQWVMEAFGAVRRDSNGKPLGIFGTAQDITERTLAEEKIQQGEQFTQSILDTVDEGFIVIDRDFRILTANKAYCDQVGGVCEAIIGRHCYEISHKSSRPCYEEGEDCASRSVFETGKPHSAVHKHMDAKGSIMYVETKSFPIKDGSGTVTSVIETVNNITERHLLEEERLKTQKLESIGTLAGGIAHDFNNLLQGVFGFISMAKMNHDEREKSRSPARQRRAGAASVGEIHEPASDLFQGRQTGQETARSSADDRKCDKVR